MSDECIWNWESHCIFARTFLGSDNDPASGALSCDDKQVKETPTKAIAGTWDRRLTI